MEMLILISLLLLGLASYSIGWYWGKYASLAFGWILVGLFSIGAGGYVVFWIERDPVPGINWEALPIVWLAGVATALAFVWVGLDLSRRK